MCLKVHFRKAPNTPIEVVMKKPLLGLVGLKKAQPV